MKKFIVLIFMLIAITADAQWVQTSDGLGNNKSIYSFASQGTDIFAGVYCYPTGPSGVYRSTDNGTNWMQTSLIRIYVAALISHGDNLFAGVYYPSSSEGGVFVTSNRGANWYQTPLNKGVTTLAIAGNTIYAGTICNGLYSSTDEGLSWTQNYIENQDVLSLAVSGNSVYAATNDSGVYASTNNGVNWLHTSVDNHTVFSVTALGNKVFAGTINLGVLYSTNNGVYWSQTTLNNQWVYQLASLGYTVVAATHGSGIYLSTNNGLNWAAINNGFTGNPEVSAFLIANNYVFAGTKKSSIWRRPLSEIMEVQNSGTGIPTKYSLGQNYPNPFNPFTKIKFEVTNGFPIKKFGNDKVVGIDVKLIVYDVMGKEVQTLVNERLQSGVYEVKFDGSNLNSGVYFYKLITDDFTDTKRMILIK